jgi:hypothetical protein
MTVTAVPRSNTMAQHNQQENSSERYLRYYGAVVR